jgi:hypothetical protein
MTTYIQKFVAAFLISTLALSGCTDLQQEYYEVHQMMVEGQPFYYIDPTQGTDTLANRSLSGAQTVFVYLYVPTTGIAFDYTQFFMAIQNRVIETRVNTDRYYTVATAEIDQQITQFFIDRENWTPSTN